MKENIIMKVKITENNKKISKTVKKTYYIILAIVFCLFHFDISSNILGEYIFSIGWEIGLIHGRIGTIHMRKSGLELWFPHFDRIICTIIIDVLLILLPLIVQVTIDKYQTWCKNIINLSLTNSKIYGTAACFFKTKEISVPIEKCDNIAVSYGLMDKIRGGKTLCVRSNNSVIKLSYISNAEEFRDKVIELIDKHQVTKPITETITQKSETTSIIDELKSYKELLDSGIITKEEFEAKKKQLLGL